MPLAAHVDPPPPHNEPVLSYAPGAPERAALKRALAEMAAEQDRDFPLYIDGAWQRTGETLEVRSPHARRLLLGRAHLGGPRETERAIQAALAAQPGWQAMDLEARAAVFLRAAELAAGPYRQRLNAATMLGQSKTAHQAEIDSACELVDFLRFNVHFANELVKQQPLSSPGVWNYVDHRPLEGFVLAVTPFNFTAIAANLPSAPALLGNVVVWKPSHLAALSAQVVMEIFVEAGLPAGVINLLHGDPIAITSACLEHRDFAGLHFTGSTAVFQALWRKTAENLPRYRAYPRLVGETGGKDFVFAHASADPDALAVALVRGAFEYQGQKCSAASRAYVPRSMWKDLRDRVASEVRTLRMGDVSDFRTFVGAVIDGRAFDRLRRAQALAKDGASASTLVGGGASDEEGYFVEPTVVEVTDPKHELMQTEYFGPLLTVYAYDDGAVDDALALCDATSPYALTGAIHARDRAFVQKALGALRHAAGNVYVNDKPTGAVVGQQPFGGGRGSGTNDKAGSALNLLRWISPRTVKETFVPPKSVLYPSHLGED